MNGVTPATCATRPPIHIFRLSPDGRRVAYNNSSLFTVPVEGGQAVRLTDRSLSPKAYSWTSDGQQLAFAASPADALTGYGDQAVYLVNADGARLQRPDRSKLCEHRRHRVGITQTNNKITHLV